VFPENRYLDDFCDDDASAVANVVGENMNQYLKNEELRIQTRNEYTVKWQAVWYTLYQMRLLAVL
jgi:hypothetical protein